MKKFYFALMAVILCACGEQKSYEYFLQNPSEIDAVRKSCQKSQDKSEKEQTECENATNAYRQIELAPNKLIINLQTMVADFGAYAFAKGEILQDLGEMSNAYKYAGQDGCIKISLNEDKKSLSITKGENSDTLECKVILNNENVAKILQEKNIQFLQ